MLAHLNGRRPHRRSLSSPTLPYRLPTDAKPAPASTLVIFGASGDLTMRLLLPALCGAVFIASFMVGENC